MKKRIISAILTIMLVFTVFGTYSFAEEGTKEIDGIIWSYNDGILTVSGEGEISSDSIYDPWIINAKKNMKELVIDEGITAIPDLAFSMVNNIEK